MDAPTTPHPSIPNIVVDIDLDSGEEKSQLEVATPSPGTMAKTAAFSSPFALFAQKPPSAKFKSYDFQSDDDGKSTKSAKSAAERLGIKRPSYGDDESKASTDSERIGIMRPDYSLPDGDLPISPLNLYLKKQGASPAPKLVNESDDDSADPNFNVSMLKNERESLSVHEDADRDFERPNDGVDRFVHQQTSDGHYLMGSGPLDSSVDGIRYSLTQGKRGMTKQMRMASDSHLIDQKRKQVLKKALSQPVQSLPESTTFKIFMLLIQPKSKIFELIQVIYSPSQTTVGDILGMIPVNATEPALGSQEYIGLCRPTDASEITETNLMASGHHSGADCAKITLGEILVAIPAGYNGSICCAISKPILANPKIAKLLKRSDPLAPKRKNKAKRKSKSTRAVPNRASVSSPVETVPEADEEPSVIEEDEIAYAEKKMAIALKAAERNAAVDNKPRKPFVESSNFHDSDGEWKATSSIDSYDPLFDGSIDGSMSLSLQETMSINSSYTFQSHSKRIPRRMSRRRQRRSQQQQYALRMAAAALAFMVGRFLMEDRVEVEEDEEVDSFDKAFGLLGLFQSLVLFLGLIKLQEAYMKKRTRKTSKRGAKSQTKRPQRATLRTAKVG